MCLQISVIETSTIPKKSCLPHGMMNETFIIIAFNEQFAISFCLTVNPSAKCTMRDITSHNSITTIVLPGLASVLFHKLFTDLARGLISGCIRSSKSFIINVFRLRHQLSEDITIKHINNYFRQVHCFLSHLFFLGVEAA